MNNTSSGKSSKSKIETPQKTAKKIDPGILTKGLSSRVVLYYDRKHGAGRSAQTKPIVKRSPVVHFNKNCGGNTDKSLKRSSPGHIKIAAPGKRF